MKYLVVDDDATFRDRLVRSLIKRGDEAVAAANANEGRLVARNERPDRAVVDLRMQGASGLELISWLREDSPSLPIVVLTGFGSIATTQEAIRRGAQSYLTKPCSLDRVVEAFEPLTSAEPGSVPIPTLDQVEWEHVQRVLADYNGNVTHAAKALGMDRRSLQRRLAKTPKLR
ncbi:MAG: response regulator [Deltaproteobacteria bacterium]|nr:response regulator [Deltaproteobacteria bacterium]